MKYIVDGKQMKEIDDYTIKNIGIPSMVLMERAALAVVSVMKQYIRMQDTILCVCGTGNNGGDGVAVARILSQDDYKVTILLLGEKENAKKDTKQQLEIAEQLSIDILNHVKVDEYTIIVDAIFGIGLGRPIKDPFKSIIERMNQVDGLIFSIDIPSGIHSENGKVMNVAVRADHTITFGFYKQGMILHPGTDYAGEISIADIGFPLKALEHVQPTAFLYEMDDIKKLPKRPRYSNKGTFGKVLIIAGSKNMSGACFLSAKAAYRSGAGLVKIITVEENREALQSAIPEAVLMTYNQSCFDENIDEIVKEIKEATSIVIGPGLGKEPLALHLSNLVLENAKSPTIIDADCLNLLSKNTRYVNKIEVGAKTNSLSFPHNVILTPHLKEMSRLLDCSVSEIQDDILKLATSSLATPATLVLKDARTIITDGEKVYLNISGNPGMATAGTGDVLTGIIAAFAAQGVSNFEAASLGVYVHGLAGDKAASKKGVYSLMSHDIINEIHDIIKGCE